MRGLTLEQLIEELQLIYLETSDIDPKIGFDPEVILYKIYVKPKIIISDKNLKKALIQAIDYIKKNRIKRSEELRSKDYIFKPN